MKTWTVGCCLFLAVGCAGSAAPVQPQSVPSDPDAVLIWQAYLSRQDEPPAVTWVDGVLCTPGSPWVGMVTAGGECVGGTIDNNAPYQITVVRPVPVANSEVAFGEISSSALVHELTHAYLVMTYGDIDNGHSHYLSVWAKVPVINNELRYLNK